MAGKDLKHLLNSYRFLDTAVESHGAAMAWQDRDTLRYERASAFRQLLTHPSDDPAVTMLQLTTLKRCLSNAPDDAHLAAMVAAAARRHRRQAKHAVEMTSASSPAMG